jgi:hypothetical protein
LSKKKASEEDTVPCIRIPSSFQHVRRSSANKLENIIIIAVSAPSSQNESWMANVCCLLETTATEFDDKAGELEANGSESYVA